MTKPAKSEKTIADHSDSARYLFRGDDRYRGGQVGRALGPDADAADIQSFPGHVLRKESRLTSRFVSFTTELKIARKFTSTGDDRSIRKVELARLRILESQGIVRIWDPNQVFNAMTLGPKKLAKQAADVRAAMRRNSEILIEGQIPAEVLGLVSE